MSMTISFPQGVAVDATLDGHTVRTDQPPPLGRGEAMSPFDLFFASLGTCMGFYALRFCQERNITTEDLRLEIDRVYDAAGRRVSTVRVSLELPPDFPEKYVDAIKRAVDHCAVKRLIADPPAFELSVVPSPLPRKTTALSAR
jgi:putative redox protein